MPFTAFHLGPAVLLGLLLYRHLDLPTFVAANVLVDTRAALILLGPWEGQIHGPLQTVAGGTVVGIVLAGVVYRWYGPVQRVMAQAGLAQEREGRRIVAAALLGAWLHVALDSVVWADMQPFAPAAWNPFLGLAGVTAVHAATVLAAVLAVPVYVHGRRTGRYPETV